MHPDAPALEAVATTLDQTLERIVGLADRHRAERDEAGTAELDELERALRSARRRLERMLRTCG